MKLILTRYGEYTDGHLNDQGRQTMKLVAESLQCFTKKGKVCIISVKVPRAIDSAKVLAQELSLGPIQSFAELYAAPEEGIEVNLTTALQIIDTVAQDKDVVIAVISREYIEVLFKHFELPNKNLNRGEILAISYEPTKH